MFIFGGKSIVLKKTFSRGVQKIKNLFGYRTLDANLNLRHFTRKYSSRKILEIDQRILELQKKVKENHSQILKYKQLYINEGVVPVVDKKAIVKKLLS